jgi:hypothetical protein
MYGSWRFHNLMPVLVLVLVLVLLPLVPVLVGVHGRFLVGKARVERVL